MKNYSDFRSTCPISSALDIVGDKWSLLILRDLLLVNKKTFKDFSTSEEAIATNILSDRLLKLEASGIISKSKLPDNKKVNIYKVTAKGLDFLPIIAEYILWSYKHLNTHISTEAKHFAEQLLLNKGAVLEVVRKNHL